MKVLTKKGKEVHLIFEEEEANWLKAFVQNPINTPDIPMCRDIFEAIEKAFPRGKEYSFFLREDDIPF